MYRHIDIDGYTDLDIDTDINHCRYHLWVAYKTKEISSTDNSELLSQRCGYN